MDLLTPREHQIMVMATDETLHEIARRYGISRNTVMNHMKNVYRKIGARSLSEAIAILDDNCPNWRPFKPIVHYWEDMVE